MRQAPLIPSHEIGTGDNLSVPFRFVALERDPEAYDTSRPHRHNYVELFWFERGGGSHDIDFDRHGIRDQSLHVVLSGQVHQVTRDSGCRGYVLLFREDFLNGSEATGQSGLDYLVSLPPTLPISGHWASEISGEIAAIRDIGTPDNQLRADIVRSRLRILILTAADAADALSARPSLESPVRRFSQLLESSYREEHSPGFYATEIGVTTGHLNALLKEHLGATTSESIRRRVMLEARRLLAHSDHSIGEIAWYLGYEDPAYFTRLFRAEYSVSPTAFRNRYRKS